MQVSKRFDFCTASAFGDKRLTLVHEDAAEFVKREVRPMTSRVCERNLVWFCLACFLYKSIRRCRRNADRDVRRLFVPGRKVVGFCNRDLVCARFLRPLLDDIPLFLTPCKSAGSLQGNNEYDVIIVDSSDPVGPAETLFQPTFYQVRDACNRGRKGKERKGRHAMLADQTAVKCEKDVCVCIRWTPNASLRPRFACPWNV